MDRSRAAMRCCARATGGRSPCISRSPASRLRAAACRVYAGCSNRPASRTDRRAPMSRLDADIDRLYQGPLADFTAERNALAKRAGAQAAEIRGLTKPTVPAWAVNQLYWQNRPVYDRLIERADDLRATHTAALRGQRTDLRGAGRAHEEALEEALKAVLALMTASGQPVTDATRQAISTTLRSLPGDEPPGRLSRQLEPRGFEMLSLAATPGRVHPAATAPKTAPSEGKKDREKEGKRDDKAARAAAARIAAAREALAAAARAVRDA